MKCTIEIAQQRFGPEQILPDVVYLEHDLDLRLNGEIAFAARIEGAVSQETDYTADSADGGLGLVGCPERGRQ